MIVRMTGVILEVHESYAVIERDGVGYEVLICGYSAAELTACQGQERTLHMMEYFEGSAAGGNLIPRLVGFLHPEDRSFFERFITVKGIGVRKALKALSQPVAAVASAIESSDAGSLAKLPGIGKRAADQIIAELKGKVTEFAAAAVDLERPALPAEGWSSQQRDAMEVMAALGERRADAQRWLARAAQLHPGEHPPDEWIHLAYRVRSSEG
ncbi:MAG: Holliday junction DNA helicase RuvA [Planctomycetes bacterium]|nr:Holliday junction DNA helicase RuvA [Planctomycetota bacterium]